MLPCLGAVKWAALATGLLSTVSIALLGGALWSKWLALLPALSTFCLSAERTFDFKGRSGWHHEKRVALSRLLLRLDSGEDRAAIASDRLQIEESFGSKFPHGFIAEQGR
jgi:hypothetical protein